MVAFREYYRGVESGSTGLEMALNEVFAIYYVIDDQIDEDNGELGRHIAQTILFWLVTISDWQRPFLLPRDEGMRCGHK